jgi:hypothetical protein
MKKTAASLGLLFLFMAHVALAVDDGQTQPKVSTTFSNSNTTATDLIATTNGSGNVKGVACKLTQDGSGFFSAALVKFYVNGGSAQSVTLTSDYMLPSGTGPYADGYTGWVPFNVRFTSSIRITIQKATSSGLQIDCAVSWGLD